MILVDVNLLVYAWDRLTFSRDSRLGWLDGELSKSPRVGIPWESLFGFMRVVTNPRIYERPAAVNTAWAQVEAWLSAHKCLGTPADGATPGNRGPTTDEAGRRRETDSRRAPGRAGNRARTRALFD